MVKRDVALCDGKLIGIESIFTVINGQQINVPEKLKELRDKSQRNKLYCSCGCSTNLILVAAIRGYEINILEKSIVRIMLRVQW